MLERAAAAVALVVDRVWPDASSITVLAGPGGNGAGGATAARRMAASGRHVRLVFAGAAKDSPAADAAADALLGGVPVTNQPPEATHVIIDAMLGYSQHGPARAPFDAWTVWANQHPGGKLALDVPTGIDPTDGTVHAPAFEAEHTLMLGVGKTGLRNQPAAGRLWIADLGWTPELDPRLAALARAVAGAGPGPWPID